MHGLRRYVLAAGMLFRVALASQANPCDPQLIQPTSNPYGYRLRGDRCEGVFVQQVAGEDIKIASWTESLPAYDLTLNRPLVIEWDTPEKTDVRLVAYALRRRLYYQMDAIEQAGGRSYRWQTDLLASLGIGSEELGILASIRLPAGDSDHLVYLPVRVGQDEKPARSRNYNLVIVPGEEVKEIYVTIAAAVHDSPALKKDQALGYGYYPAGRAVKIPIARPSLPGIYRVEIGAVFRSGVLSTAEMWFYNPRR